MSELSTELRTHTCGELRAEDASKKPPEDRHFFDFAVKLVGHVDGKPGKRGFWLRDRFGKTLVELDERVFPKPDEVLANVGPEDVVQACGEAAFRDASDVDPKSPTGRVMLLAKKVEGLSRAVQPIPEVGPGTTPALEDRIAGRPLYLRRPEMQERLEFRSRLMGEIQEYLVGQSFQEIETPHLFWYDRVAIASEPIPVEGGKAFSLPSGGLVLDQYIVAGHFERFFQFLRITRRELRGMTPRHAPEHTLLDLNLCYVDRPAFQGVVEGLIAHAFKKMLGVALKTPFKSFSYAEMLEKYGTDKADLRFGLELEPGGGNERRFRVPGAPALDADELGAVAAAAGAGATVALSVDGADAIVAVSASAPELANAAAGAVRNHVGRRLGIAPKRHEPVWIHSYPYLTPHNGHLEPAVVVFSAPNGSDFADHLPRDRFRSQAFDLVIDGVEIASGYIGNHSTIVQRMIWGEIFKFATADLVRVRAPLEAHRFGVPPHGGMNVGFDRIVALMLGLEAIDECMYFPKTPECRDPLLEAPAPVPLEAVESIVGEAPPAEPADQQLVEDTVNL